MTEKSSSEGATLSEEGKQRRLFRARPIVMVIDDDEFVRNLALAVLCKDSEVVAAANGQEGIDIYAMRVPDVTFLDIDMPDMNGIEVLKRLMAFDPEAKI